jgi:enamine deaminase RidA (YjgF/YER057c/UK114 family)
MLPVVDHKPKYVGRLGQELDTESGRDALRTASMSALAAARAHLGTLDKVTRVVRLGIYLATSGDFFDQPKVADAASELFESIFGKEKTSVRMVLGVASLPLGMPVELEVILEVAE